MLKIPEHVAFIMDGNRRWAKRRGLPVIAGYRAGAQTLRKLAVEAEKMGVKHITVYAFSTENWNRPESQVSGLMRLLREYIQQYIDDSKKNDMRISVVGDISRLDEDLRKQILKLTEFTAKKRGLHVHIALNYGGRDEIVRTARRLATRVRDEAISPEAIDEAFFEQHLDTAGIPDPELIIRTSGEMRLSNFLLWQVAYSEFYITDIFWPDFTSKELVKAFEWYANVERRFGAQV